MDQYILYYSVFYWVGKYLKWQIKEKKNENL